MIANNITENTNKLCNETLARLIQLIDELKLNKKTYMSVRHGLETEFTKVS